MIQRVIRMRKSSGYTRCWLELHCLWLSRKPDHIRYSSQPRFHMIFNTKVTWSQNQITSRRDKCCQFHQESKTTKKEPWQPQTLVLTRKHFLISTPLCSYVTILKCLIPFLQTKLLDFFCQNKLNNATQNSANSVFFNTMRYNESFHVLSRLYIYQKHTG